MGIHKALNILLPPSAHAANDCIKKPNALLFGGDSALNRMLGGKLILSGLCSSLPGCTTRMMPDIYPDTAKLDWENQYRIIPPNSRPWISLKVWLIQN